MNTGLTDYYSCSGIVVSSDNILYLNYLTSTGNSTVVYWDNGVWNSIMSSESSPYNDLYYPAFTSSLAYANNKLYVTLSNKF